jgi:hypothetical protein
MLAALPGIREIRSALAGGYLWIAFCWILLDPSLGKGDFNLEPYQSVHHLGHELGPFALGIALTFAAYLIGTGANELRGLVSTLYLRARQSATDSLSAEERAEIVVQAREQNRKSRERLKIQRRRLSRIPLRRRRSIRKRRTLLGDIQSATNILGQMLRPSFELFASGFTTLMRAVVDTTELSEEVAAAIATLLSRVGADPYKPYLSYRGVKTVHRYLAKSLPEASVDEAPTVADVIVDFPVLRSRLIHSSPDTVSEIDRLNAEADFRSAIVLPLMAIAAVFGFEVSALWFLTWPFLLALRMTARRRRYDAGELMADSLVREVISAPSVETYLGDARGGTARA